MQGKNPTLQNAKLHYQDYLNAEAIRTWQTAGIIARNRWARRIFPQSSEDLLDTRHYSSAKSRQDNLCSFNFEAIKTATSQLKLQLRLQLTKHLGAKM